MSNEKWAAQYEQPSEAEYKEWETDNERIEEAQEKQNLQLYLGVRRVRKSKANRATSVSSISLVCTSCMRKHLLLTALSGLGKNVINLVINLVTSNNLNPTRCQGCTLSTVESYLSGYDLPTQESDE